MKLFCHRYTIPFSVCLFFMLVGDPASCETTNWPGWRGDGTGISDCIDTPVHWNASTNVAWKTYIPGKGRSSPVVFGDRVFVTTAVQGSERNSLRFSIWCLLGGFGGCYTVVMLRNRRLIKNDVDEIGRQSRALVLATICGWIFVISLLTLELALNANGNPVKAWVDSSSSRTWLLTVLVCNFGLIAGLLSIRGNVYLRVFVGVVVGLLTLFSYYAVPDTIQIARRVPKLFASIFLPLGLLVGFKSRGKQGVAWIATGTVAVLLVLGLVIYLHRVAEFFILDWRFWIVSSLSSSAVLAVAASRAFDSVETNDPHSGENRSSIHGLWACLLLLAMVQLEFYAANFLIPKQGLKRCIVCLDFQTGALLWQEGYIMPEEPVPRQNSHATPTPVTDGEFVYAYFGSAGAMCATVEGEVKWINRSLPYETRYGASSSPLLEENVLYLACDGDSDSYVVGLDARTGSVIWRTERRTDPSFGTPMIQAVNGERQLVVAGGRLIAGYDLANGEVLWSSSIPVSEVVNSVFVNDDLAYFSGGWQGTDFLAVDLKSQQDVADVVWQTRKSAPYYASPVVSGQRLFMCSDLGVVTCVKARTGDIIWRKRLKGEFTSSPVLANGLLYFLSTDGEVTVLRDADEYERIGTNTIDMEAVGCLAVAHDAVLLRSKQYLWSFRTDSKTHAASRQSHLSKRKIKKVAEERKLSGMCERKL